MYELKVIRHFSAAHQLRGYKGKCEELHGHNYKVVVSVLSEKLNDIGLAIDFKELKSLIDKMLDRFDHHLMNDIPPFDSENPSAENIARVIYSEIKRGLPDGVSLARVEVWESRNSSAAYFE